MKISAIIDSNVVSGTVLLDDLSPLTIKLIHRYTDSGVAKNLILNTVTCQPQKTVFDFSFLNPYYVESLFVEINGEMQSVMESGIGEDLDDVSNPINDGIYTQNDIPVLSEVEELVQVLPDPLAQEFTTFSHSAAPNLIEMEDYSANTHFICDNSGMRFTVNGSTIVASDVFELKHSTELTIAIKGDSPDQVRLVLINQAGNERCIEIDSSYELHGRTCYSTSIVSSTYEARIELVYNSIEARNIRIEDIYVGKTAQFFGTENTDQRVVEEKEIETYQVTGYIFDFDRIPNFGLRNILSFVGPSGIRIQLSNSRIRLQKIVNNTSVQTIMSPVVSNTSQIGVVVTDYDVKMYSDGELVKKVQFQSPTEPGNYTVELGACLLDPDYDSNAELKTIITNKNPFE